MTTTDTLPTTTIGWHKRVLQLAWPIILSNLSVPLVGVVDTAVVGQLSHPRYMAAVAVGAIIFSSVFWVFGFLRMGTTGFVSQAYGRNDQQELSVAFLRAILLAVLPAEALVGGAYGKRDRKAFSAAVKVSLLWSSIAALILSVLYAILGGFVIRLITTIEPVIQMAEVYFPWLIAAPIIAVWAYHFDGVFIGATQTVADDNCVGDLCSDCFYDDALWWKSCIVGKFNAVFIVTRGSFGVALS